MEIGRTSGVFDELTINNLLKHLIFAKKCGKDDSLPLIII